MPTQLLFSNTIESLAREVARDISRFNDFFYPSIIIVPNPYLKKWLQLKIAEINGIAMNLNFRYLEDGLWEILTLFSDRPEKYTLLGQTDLQLILYNALGVVEKNEARLQSMLGYLYNQDWTKKSDYEKKLYHLSGRLSQYFLEYEHSREEMILHWMAGESTHDSEIESAQQHLYELLFKKNGFRDSIDKTLLTLPQYWNKLLQRGLIQKNIRVLFFGLSQISPFHAKLIYTLGKYLDLTICQVNPCSEFWEDVATTQEERWQRIRSISIHQSEEGESLSANISDNPLLKLWGQAGRETIKLLSMVEDAGSSDLNFISKWINAEPVEKPATVLTTIQDLILLRRAELNSDKKLNQDKSIQVASCPDIFREAESVYSNILFNLDKDTSLRMNDIAVMVPDMTSYGPVLHSVFSRNPVLLSYSMIDSNAAIDSIFGNAVLSIIDIAMGTFTREEIFKLFRNQYFLSAHDISLDDVAIWLHWADSLNIFHDFFRHDDIDPEHNLYTWKQGLQRMRFGRLLQANENYDDDPFLDYKHIIPYSDMYTNDEDRVNMFTALIELLFARCKDLKDARLSGGKWISILEELISELLFIPDDNQEEINVYNELMGSLNKLRIMDATLNNKKGVQLSLPFIKEFITENLIHIPSAKGGYLTRGINISALVPKRQIPFKIIYIMGMQEGIFPGSRDRSTLNLNNIRRQIGDTTRIDANRYLFLETLLSAREKLYITYVSKDLQKDQDYYPNSVTGQLINYMDNYILADKFRIVPIPISASSPLFLSMIETAAYSDFITSQKENNFQPLVYNHSDRLVMLHAALHNSPRADKNMSSVLNKEIKSQIPDFTVNISGMPEVNAIVTLSLRDLSYFLSNPVESTLRWHLSLNDENEEDIASREIEPFYSVNPFNFQIILDALHNYIRSDGHTDIRKYIVNLYHHAHRMSRTPSGAYSEIDLEDIIEAAVGRVEGSNGIASFITSRRDLSFFQNIVIGQSFIDARPGSEFPAVQYPCNRGSRNMIIRLNGSLAYLWQNNNSQEYETLVITTSSEPRAGHIINPFLFYIVSASGLDNSLRDFCGNGQFTIHVSCKSGITSYPFRLDTAECRTYITELINDFLDENSRDFLPLSIITDHRLTPPPEMKIEPDRGERERYRTMLLRLIEDDADKMFPALRSSSILQLFKPEVPNDAYDKVRRRLALPLLPFRSKPR